MKMLPIQSGEGFSYFGSHRGWLIALSVHRDSDNIDVSNWETVTPDMLSSFPDDCVTEQMNHWAVGWVDYLLVRPGSAAETRAEEIRKKLDNYPVWNEEDYGQREYDDEWCVRCNRATRGQHKNGLGCRKFRSAEDAGEITWKWLDRKTGALTE